MKALAVSLVLALGLAAPALADPAKPVPAPAVAQPAADKPADEAAAIIDETAIADATTPEARRALMIRCSGPPVKRDVAEAQRRKALEAFAAEAAARPVDISLDPNFK